MIKVRIADFPGMRPGSHNVDHIVIVDYEANVKQVIRGKDKKLEATFGTRKGLKELVILEEPPPEPELKASVVVTLLIFFLGMVFERMFF